MRTRKNCSKNGRWCLKNKSARRPKVNPAGTKLWRKLQRGGLV